MQRGGLANPPPPGWAGRGEGTLPPIFQEDRRGLPPAYIFFSTNINFNTCPSGMGGVDCDGEGGGLTLTLTGAVCVYVLGGLWLPSVPTPPKTESIPSLILPLPLLVRQIPEGRGGGKGGRGWAGPEVEGNAFTP